ncbi:putative ribonuclease H-like domain-containing protein [Tanacetum coccineum]
MGLLKVKCAVLERYDIGLAAFTFQQPEFKGYGPKTSQNASKDIPNELKEYLDAPLVNDRVPDNKDCSVESLVMVEKKIVVPTIAKVEVVSPKQQEKPVRKTVKYAEMYSFDHLQAGCNYHQRKRVVFGNNYTRVNHNYSAKKTHPSAHRNMVPKAVLIKNGLRPLNTVRLVNIAHLKTTVHSATLMSRFSKIAPSTVRRPIQKKTTLTNRSFHQKVNTTRPKAVNTARPSPTVVNAVRANWVNAVKALACWVWRPTKPNGASITLKRHNYIDAQGRSKYMTGNMSYLSNFKEFNGGYITLAETLVYIRRSTTKDKGIRREFSVARTPQQNGVVERRNRTLTEAARTTLADSKLPTTFLAQAVNTACYVQNRVLVVKPHNKTPYELFRGRTPALSFMRPFRCHVTILNTLDNLGKFDGKSDEGFFVRYSLNSKAFRVYNIRTRKVEENLHIRFLEDKPIIAGDGPKWLFDIDVITKSMNYVPVVVGTNSNDFVGTEESIGAGQSSKETGSSQDYILLPLWKDGSLFDSFSKNSSNDEPQPSSDTGKKDDEGVSKESGIDDQERPRNSIKDINIVRPSINTASTNDNTGSLNINTVSLIVPTAPLEATHVDFFGDETKVDISNINSTYQVPSTLNTRIYKDYSLDYVIGDLQSSVQTRSKLKPTNGQGFISAVYEGKTYKDLNTCLFAYFLSQIEPTRVTKALSDPAWGKKAIGIKWVFKNKKDKRGIVIKNKARLVAQGYTEEEGIDYDEVFAPVARIKAIRLFLAYASFIGCMVYQMDMKSAFLYERIKDEAYVCQPPGFEDPDHPDKVYKVVKELYGLHQAPRV